MQFVSEDTGRFLGYLEFHHEIKVNLMQLFLPRGTELNIFENNKFHVKPKVAILDALVSHYPCSFHILNNDVFLCYCVWSVSEDHFLFCFVIQVGTIMLTKISSSPFFLDRQSILFPWPQAIRWSPILTFVPNTVTVCHFQGETLKRRCSTFCTLITCHGHSEIMS